MAQSDFEAFARKLVRDLLPGVLEVAAHRDQPTEEVLDGIAKIMTRTTVASSPYHYRMKNTEWPVDEVRREIADLTRGISIFLSVCLFPKHESTIARVRSTFGRYVDAHELMERCYVDEMLSGLTHQLFALTLKLLNVESEPTDVDLQLELAWGKAYKDLARTETRTFMLNAARGVFGKPTCQMQWKSWAKKHESLADDWAARMVRPRSFDDELAEDTRKEMAGASVEDLERKRDCLRHAMTVQFMMRLFPDFPATALYAATTRNEYFDAEVEAGDIDRRLFINMHSLNEVRIELARRGKEWEYGASLVQKELDEQRRKELDERRKELAEQRRKELDEQRRKELDEHRDLNKARRRAVKDLQNAEAARAPQASAPVKVEVEPQVEDKRLEEEIEAQNRELARLKREQKELVI